MTSLNDNYNYNRIARYVSHTLETNAVPVVVLTKSDLCNNVGRYVSEIEELSDKVRVQDAQNGIDDTFSDIKEYEGYCKFRDCKHMTEPGCAIKKAIEDGIFTRERYELYLSLQKENTKNTKLKKQIAVYKRQQEKMGK